MSFAVYGYLDHHSQYERLAIPAAITQTWRPSHAQTVGSSVLAPFSRASRTLYLVRPRSIPPHFVKTHLIKRRHRLISTPDLHLPKIRAPILTPLIGTINLGLVDVFPALCSAQHVFYFLALHLLAFVVALVEIHLVGTCAAFEAVLTAVFLFALREVAVLDGCYCEEVAA